jgi:hypothetical protein
MTKGRNPFGCRWYRKDWSGAARAYRIGVAAAISRTRTISCEYYDNRAFHLSGIH